MRQWSLEFKSYCRLKEFIKKNSLDKKEPLLVQVSFSKIPIEQITDIKEKIKTLLPKALLVGVSSAMQLSNREFVKGSIVISFAHFQKSKIEVFDGEVSNEESFLKVVKSLISRIKSNTKGILLIANSIKLNSEKLISEFNRHNLTIPIFGGIASDSDFSDNFFIFTNDRLYKDSAIIAVIFNGDSLQISCKHYLNWVPIGKDFIVTKCDGRYLEELDNKPVKEIYEKYFGYMSDSDFLYTAMAHPLIRDSKEFGSVARAMYSWDGKRGFFSGEFKEGESVQIGFGNYRKIFEHYETIPKVYDRLPAETVWFYVCRSYLKGYVDILNRTAKYYKYPEKVFTLTTLGEFSHENCTNRYLNYTITRVALTEDISSRINILEHKAEYDEKDKLLSTLSTLVSASSQEIIALNRDLEKQVAKRTKELAELNKSLERRISLEVKKNREKDKLLYHQAKLASMGEMINNIAHQWRQPLNIIALIMQNLSIKARMTNVSSDEILSAEKKIAENLKYLSDTIDDFRSYASSRENEHLIAFEVNRAIKDVSRLISVLLEDEKITLELNLPSKEALAPGSPNDLKQVLLNLAYNAIDVFKERGVKDPTIKITVKYNASINISVKDNAGGIKEHIIDKIFEPYFTTKYQSRGTGLGLYMSKMIVEKRLSGRITARNTSRGALFWIELPLFRA